MLLESESVRKCTSRFPDVQPWGRPCCYTRLRDSGTSGCEGDYSLTGGGWQNWACFTNVTELRSPFHPITSPSPRLEISKLHMITNSVSGLLFLAREFLVSTIIHDWNSLPPNILDFDLTDNFNLVANAFILNLADSLTLNF